ncbi:MAG: 2-oxoglutarate and iron-dependent oxygenase domain-containing protein [Actinomycetota bacterium]
MPGRRTASAGAMLGPVIPVLDLADPDLAARLDGALCRFGFVELTGHGLDPAARAELWAAMDDWFALPGETKRRYVVDDPVANRGYRQRGSEALSYSVGMSSPPDLFESFNVGHDDRGPGPIFAPTPWPAEVPAFAPAVRRHLAAMAALSARLDGVLGAILGLPDLVERSRRGPDTMACIRYERSAAEDDPAEGQVRMGAHSDYTTFSILVADPVPGLEILGPDGEWIGVTPGADGVLLNVGDLLAMWTNDRWPSTLHRVPLPDGSAGAVRRSVAYFHYPDPDVVVAPLAGEPRYAPVRVDEHLVARLVGPKEQRASGTDTLAGREV